MRRFIADYLITADADHSVYSPGAIDIEGGVVVWVGPADEAPSVDRAGTDGEPQGAVGSHDVEHIPGILAPGFVNVHAHTPMLLLRGAGEGLPVDRWLREVMWPFEKKLVPEDVHAGMMLGAAELLGNGVTTSVEMYFHGEAIARAAVSTGLRVVAAPPIIEDEEMSVFGPWQERLASIGELAEKWVDEPRVEIAFGPHAPYSTSEECLRAVAELAKSREMLVSMHVSEQRWEDDAIRERTGRSAVELLESTGILEGRFLAAHCVWLTEAEIERFAEHSVAVAHCPCSNCKHASGIAPVRAMRAGGVTVGIATDGPASHRRLDLFEEMRMAIRLARVHHGDSTALPARDVLRMVTAEAANAIGRPDLGRLAVGARADMIALSPDVLALHPMIPGDDVIARFVWAGSSEAIHSVWAEGERVVLDGEVLCADLRQSIQIATERANGLRD